MTRIPRLLLVAALLLCLVGWRRAAAEECLLANPSFEIPGSSGTVFGGWSQFGSIGSSTKAIHGARSARVSGPNNGTWDVSGYWQNLVTPPGQRWTATVWVSNPSSRPLSGGSKAIVNIEWRNASGGLISYESFTAADAATPTDQFRMVTFTSQPAPVGTVSTHIVLGVLQGPTDPMPDVLYDHATFRSLGPPTPEDRQWIDFPGGRTIAFGGRTWRVKGPGWYEPGPSLFSDAADAVWVDVDGRLHLTIRLVSGSWRSTEVTLEQPLGYGDYVFTTRGRIDTLDPKAVLGLFLWEYGACYDTALLWWNPFNEIDIEFSRWGVPSNSIGQFVAQPFDTPGNLVRFDATFGVDEVTSHAFRWLPGRVEFRSWRGDTNAESPATLIHAWTYSGLQLPRPDVPRVHLNLWQFTGPPAANQEVVFDAFTFKPACPTTPCTVTSAAAAEIPRPVVGAPQPNPFQTSTTLRYRAPRAGRVDIMIFDVSGRLVRTLYRGSIGEGEHAADWDGRDDHGRRVGTGVYLCRFRMDGAVQTKRLVLAR